MHLAKTSVYEVDKYGDKTAVQEFHYNRHGNIVIQVEFDPEGDLLLTNYLEYSPDHYLMVDKLVMLDGTSQTTYYDYTGEGEYAQIKTVFEDGTCTLQVFEELENKRVRIAYDTENKVEEIEVNELDRNGAPVLTLFYDNSNKEVGRIVSQYDIHGNLISEDIVGDGQEFSRTRYTYDHNHNVLVQSTHDQEGNVIFHEEFTYQNGLLTKRVTSDYYSSEVVIHASYEYNENNQLLRKIEKDPSGNLISSRVLSYDSHGNPDREVILKTGYFNAIYGTGTKSKNTDRLYINEYE